MEHKQSQLRVWLYYRLSRDDDPEKDSLTNQKNLLSDFAEKEGFIVVGESFDDNLSGMHFDKRTGIDTLMDVAKLGNIDAVLVKDLSRFGRHRLLAPLYREQLKVYGVRVLSATESLDTFNESDDLMIGFKDLINDAYARDISRKIRAGFSQKQKKGLVLLQCH